jgi:raffinose/stachyose/melibiose transport system substrate-binding protein
MRRNLITRSKLTPIGATLVALLMVFASASSSSGSTSNNKVVTLKLETWRTEDASIWNEKIIPVFEKKNPGIKIDFAPTNYNEYGSAITTRLQGGTAGDLITQIPYGSTLVQMKQGQLESIKGLAGLANYSKAAIAPWSFNGSPYCVPLASVGAGFFYNKDIFKELNLKVPTTQSEFISVLNAIKKNGKYTPLALGGASADSWALDQMGLESVGPNYWKGDTGRAGIENGTMKVTDSQFVAAFKALNSWKPYFPKGFAAVTYPDALQLFALGKAAIFPDGSWDITEVTKNGLNVGVFAPPVQKAGDQVYAQSLPDHAACLNAVSPNKKEAKVFLQWLTTPQFAQLYADSIPGFYPMSSAPVKLSNALGQAWFNLRKAPAKVSTPVGLNMNQGASNWGAVVGSALNKMLTSDSFSPEQAAKQVQTSIASWYEPQKKNK